MLWWTLLKLKWQLRDKDWLVRERALLELARIDHPWAAHVIERALTDKNQEIRVVAAECLCEHPNPAVLSSLLEALCNPQNDLPARLAVQRAIAALGPQAFDRVAEKLSDNSYEARTEMAEILGQWQEPQAVAGLAAAAQNQDLSLRKAAVYALGQIASPACLEPLLDALDDPGWMVRAEAAEALGRIADPRALEPLLSKASEERWTVRLSVSKALSHYDDPRAVDSLVQRLEDAREEVRQTAIQVLGRMAAPQAVAPLLALARDPEFAREATDALQSILTQAAGDLAQEDLQALADLENVLQNKYEVDSEEALTAGVPIEARGEEEIDCSPLRELAGNELSRRAAA